MCFYDFWFAIHARGMASYQTTAYYCKLFPYFCTWHSVHAPVMFFYFPTLLSNCHYYFLSTQAKPSLYCQFSSFFAPLKYSAGFAVPLSYSSLSLHILLLLIFQCKTATKLGSLQPSYRQKPGTLAFFTDRIPGIHKINAGLWPFSNTFFLTHHSHRLTVG